MSGFLQRLVARHTSTPPIRPRLPSRFESGHGGLAAGEWEHHDSAVVRGGVSTPAPPDAIGDARTSDRVARVIGDEEAHEIVPTPGPDDAARRPATPGSSLARQRAPARSPEETDLESEWAPRERLAPASPDAAQRTAPPPELRVEPQETDRSRGTRLLRDAVRPRASMEPRMPMGRIALAPPPATDVVQVHIGRVEVRAVMAPAERPRPAQGRAAPAPLPLDRYLSGNGRR